jgi:hypothetical protein
MKRALRIVALAVALVAGSFWLATGANRGWTKTLVPVKTADDVTGIEGITYKKQFTPGLDFLGAALFGAGILAGSSFIFRNPKQQQRQNNVPIKAQTVDRI